MFEVGTLLPGRVAGWRAANPSVDWFLSGVLAVVIASPCTAPLMGAALGYAIGESGWRAFAVFTALGVGMALPYVLLAWFPGWLKRVPKPGPWMVRLKQALAFPLYGTVVWLAWVLGEQAARACCASSCVCVAALGRGRRRRRGGARACRGCASRRPCSPRPPWSPPSRRREPRRPRRVADAVLAAVLADKVASSPPWASRCSSTSPRRGA